MNYDPVRDPEGVRFLRKNLKKEVLAGRMIGGTGWTAALIRSFFGNVDFYGIAAQLQKTVIREGE